ncbi:hypothetical protein AAIB33_08070 [Microbacterium sp. AZCO]
MFRNLTHALRARFDETVGDERGDVPGWVLITLMTAGLLVVTLCRYS